jgi:hypothetical protein
MNQTIIVNVIKDPHIFRLFLLFDTRDAVIVFAIFFDSNWTIIK